MQNSKEKERKGNMTSHSFGNFYGGMGGTWNSSTGGKGLSRHAFPTSQTSMHNNYVWVACARGTSHNHDANVPLLNDAHIKSNVFLEL